ncbi:UDP-4-amino-4,6-dideoxy-N-acetyl-beta-L-altrosamine transaminase [Chelativorans sp. ZYF759]|uniref:UDP-4-amino-4, 6-dideoxy-N-acetyl-beta-L-altrosamine transaminase n=1 Tax=Chelativorans sp. ZYF759 TaxID=2692213 RepID=UPI00145C3C14|nr:UDP-4-amino-4,6-dideoxy-N-acetyl-beta-L-altrosamine transaminase [Chelativorans sp. ZYF759]
MIPYGRQDISKADIEAVVSVLQSDYLTQGPVVGRFERAVADIVGARYAVASNSATSSLHLACLALGVGPGDVVWTTPVTFVASANCARYCGAGIDFVDIDLKSYNISVSRLSDKLRAARDSGRLPKALVVVHLAGHSADMERIRELSREYGFAVIEDASHAIGGSYRSTKIGSCAFSDITVFSFHPVKIVTSGEGGMALTNDADLARSMARLNSHGITRETAEMKQEPDGPWYYEQIGLGFNYRMTDIHAALGLSQLSRLEEFLARRHALAARYDAALSDLPLVLPWRDPRDYSGFHLYIVRLNDGDQSRHRSVFEKLRANGVLVNLHYMPVYRQPDFQQFGFKHSDFPEAEAYYATAITIPLFPTMTEPQQDYVVNALREALR